MLIDIPDRYIPMLLESGVRMGEAFFHTPIGSAECLMVARQIIEKHPDDLEKYLADFLYGIKLAEMNHD